MTFKIESFCVVQGILFSKMKLFSILENKFKNGTHLIKKRAIFDLLFIFSSHQEKDTKTPLAHV